MPKYEVETVRMLLVEADDETTAKAVAQSMIGKASYAEGVTKIDGKAVRFTVKAFPGGVSSICRAITEMRC